MARPSHRSWLIRLGAHLAVFAVSAGGISAQPADPLDPARQALEAGRLDEALSLVNAVLAGAPDARQAVSVKIDVLIETGNIPEALAAYDAFRHAGGETDARLLGRIALGELHALTLNADPRLSTAALERLARLGRAEAKRRLIERFEGDADPATGRSATEALARLGDERARERLLDAAQQGRAASRVAAFQALALAEAPGAQDLLVAGLTDADIMVRAAAARALARFRAPDATAALTAALQDRVYLVRLEAAATLTHVGDATGDEILKTALTGQLPDATLLAARAYSGREDTSWIPYVEPLLDNQDGYIRLHAAELLLDARPHRAAEVLEVALRHANPAVRTETARILASRKPGHPGVLRACLDDQNAWVRLYGSVALTDPHESPAP